MALSFNTALPTNWEALCEVDLTAETPPGEVEALYRYYPIPDYVCPLTSSSKLIAIIASSESAEPHWRYAGRVIQKVNTGLSPVNEPQSVLTVKRFYFNQINLIKYFDDYGSIYSLTFSIPYWIRDISLSSWEYTGTITDSYEVLMNEIKTLVS